MSSRITFDIETYRTRNKAIGMAVQQEAIAKRAVKNAPKDVKIMWDTPMAQRDRAKEALARTAVDVTMAEVLCVVFMVDGEEVEAVEGMRQKERLAMEELKEVWEEIATEETVWVGHNIAASMGGPGFDMAVLLNRWRKHGITPPKHFPRYIDGRWRGRIFDTMLRTPSKTPFISLEDTCIRYGVKSLVDTMWNGGAMDGSRVGAAFEAKAYDTILEYCEVDVIACDELYQKMTFNGEWGTYGENDDLADQIRSILKEDELTEAQRKITIYNLLDAAGRIPRN